MFGMTQKSLLIGLSLIVLLAAGCQVVHVKDQQGKAVAWANVSVSTQSGSSNFPVKTDMLGNATLMVSQEQPGTREWLEVSKTGYLTRRIIRPEDGKVEVILMKSGPRKNAKKKP